MVRSRLALQLLGWSLVVGIFVAMRLAQVPAEIVETPSDLEMQALLGDVGGTVTVLDETSQGGVGMTAPLSHFMIRDAVAGVVGCLVTFGLWALYRRTPVPHSGAALLVGAILGSVVGAAVWYLLAAVVDAAMWREMPFAHPVDLGLVASALFLNVLVLAAWHGVAIALWHVQRTERAERLAQAARLEALRYQLNPHFLFNALSSAIALIDEAPTRAQAMLTQLSRLLRDTLRDTAVTTVGDELALVERYVDIERVRYEDKLRFQLACTADARACRIPPLVVQALVENAIKHGMRSSPMPLHVQLGCAYDGEWLYIDVSNTGRLDEPVPGGGVGLRNLVQRLETLFPGRHRFTLDERDGRVHASVAVRRPERA